MKKGNKRTYDEVWTDSINDYRKAFCSIPIADGEIMDDVIFSVSYKLYNSGKDELTMKRFMREGCKRKLIDIWRKKKNEPAIESLVEEIAIQERQEDGYARLEEILAGLPEQIKETARAFASGIKQIDVARELGISDRTIRQHQEIIKTYLERTKDYFTLNI